MNDQNPNSFARVLRKIDVISSADYAAHRNRLAKRIQRLRQRERFARCILIGLGVLAMGSLLVVMGLERLTRTWTTTEPFRSITEVVHVVFAISWLLFPLLLTIYLLRHLPNWWIASQSHQEGLLQEIADSKQRGEGSNSQTALDREVDTRPPESRSL